MGTSNPAMLRAIAAARDATAAGAVLTEIQADSKRAADNSQVIVDQLVGEPEATP